MGEMKVLRGKKNFKDVGKVITFNGETGNAWQIVLRTNPFDPIDFTFVQNPMHGMETSAINMSELIQL